MPTDIPNCSEACNQAGTKSYSAEGSFGSVSARSRWKATSGYRTPGTGCTDLDSHALLDEVNNLLADDFLSFDIRCYILQVRQRGVQRDTQATMVGMQHVTSTSIEDNPAHSHQTWCEALR
jgi:hypothetical protein